MTQILIGTALIKVTSEDSNSLLCRALLDSGSHLNFISEHLVKVLNLQRFSANKVVSGIGTKETTIRSKVYLTVSSRVSNYSINLEFFVIPKITNCLPSQPVTVDISLVPVDIQLADPYFHVPDKIDVLLGAEIYNSLFNGRSITILKNLPPFYSTVFGYVISGRVMMNHSCEVRSVNTLCILDGLYDEIKRFWELETIPAKNKYSLEEKYCEDHYVKTHRRLRSGQYSVSLPLNENINQLGVSNASSLKQFFSIEQKLCGNPEIYTKYQEFMSEYLSLGHMVLIPDSEINKRLERKTYHLPHHFVLKPSSTTTQLRVVFNGSFKSSSKLSLNDCLHKGPTG